MILIYKNTACTKIPKIYKPQFMKKKKKNQLYKIKIHKTPESKPLQMQIQLRDSPSQ